MARSSDKILLVFRSFSFSFILLVYFSHCRKPRRCRHLKVRIRHKNLESVTKDVNEGPLTEELWAVQFKIGTTISSFYTHSRLFDRWECTWSQEVIFQIWNEGKQAQPSSLHCANVSFHSFHLSRAPLCLLYFFLLKLTSQARLYSPFPRFHMLRWLYSSSPLRFVLSLPLSLNHAKLSMSMRLSDGSLIFCQLSFLCVLLILLPFQ